MDRFVVADATRSQTCGTLTTSDVVNVPQLGREAKAQRGRWNNLQREDHTWCSAAGARTEVNPDWWTRPSLIFPARWSRARWGASV